MKNNTIKSLLTLTVLIFTAIMVGCIGEDEKKFSFKLNLEDISEKSSVEFSISSDSELNDIYWRQTSGPILQFTGGNSETISFIAPSVIRDRRVSFTVIASNNSGRTRVKNGSFIIQANLIETNIDGLISIDGYGQSDVLFDAQGYQASTTADANGRFNLTVQMDDDLTVGRIKATPNTAGRHSLVSLVNIKATESDTSSSENLVNINTVTTALYAYVTEIYNGLMPKTTDELLYAETTVTMDRLNDAATAARVIINQNNSYGLPNKYQTMTAFLQNKSDLDSYINLIKSNNPNLFNQTLQLILEEQQQFAPLTAEQLTGNYFDIYPSVPWLYSRSGAGWSFNENGTGSYFSRDGNADFTWQVSGGQVNINFTNGFEYISYPFATAGVAGLTQQDVDDLNSQDIFQIEATYTLSSMSLKRLINGALVAGFSGNQTHIEAMAYQETTGGISVGPSSTTITDTTESYFRPTDSLQNFVFSSVQLPGKWAMPTYEVKTFTFNGNVINFYTEIMTFLDDGTGTTNSGRSFVWNIDSNGELSINFNSGYDIKLRIIEEIDGHYSVFTSAYNSAGELIATVMDVAVKIQDSISWTKPSITTRQNEYWQSMVNGWTSDDWNGEKYLLCRNYDCGSYNSFFGWSFENNSKGNRIISYHASGNNPAKPTTIEALNANQGTGWSIQANDWLRFYYEESSLCDGAVICRFREWRLLAVEKGKIGQRIIVLERDMYRETSSSPYEYFIGDRINIYEKIPISYWTTLP